MCVCAGGGGLSADNAGSCAVSVQSVCRQYFIVHRRGRKSGLSNEIVDVITVVSHLWSRSVCCSECHTEALLQRALRG